MLPDSNEPCMQEIMSTYSVLATRLRKLREKFPYRIVHRQGGSVLIYVPVLSNHEPVGSYSVHDVRKASVVS
jgi:hypothetical protein